MDVHFLGEEEEILREIKAIPQQMIRIVECLKTSKAPGAEDVCPGDEKHKNLNRYRQNRVIIWRGCWWTHER